MSPQERVLELFRASVEVTEEQIDLVESVLLIAQGEYPHLDRATYRQRLDEMGHEAHVVCTGSTMERLAHLSRLFAGRWRFRGNREDYYDPRNSFLNDVLDRRTGIPITLALVYMEAGCRAGIPLVGIGMPGHFLVGCTDRSDVYVDAFSEGALLTREECAGRLRRLHPEAVFRPEFLAPVGPRLILTRMLNNLLEIYLQTGQFSKALLTVEMIFCLQPGDPECLRRRALIHCHLKNYARAIADLERYLERAPGAADHKEVVHQLAALHQLRGMVN